MDTLLARISVTREPADLDAVLPDLLAHGGENIERVLGAFYERRVEFSRRENDRDKEEEDGWRVQVLESDFNGPNTRKRPEDDLLVPHSWSQTDPFDIWKKMPDAAFQLIWREAQDPCVPPPVRSRYLTFLWVMRETWEARQLPGLPPRPDLVLKTTDALIEAATWFRDNGQDPLTTACNFVRRLDVAAALAAIFGHRNRIWKALQDVSDWLSRYGDAAPHWLFKLMKVKVEVGLGGKKNSRLSLTAGELDTLASEIGSVTTLLAKSGAFGAYTELEVDAAELSARVDRARGVPPSEKAIYKKKGDVFRAKAVACPSGLLRMEFWHQASAWYERAGDRELATEAKRKSREAVQEAEAAGEFKTVGASGKIDLDLLNRAFDPVFQGAKTAAEVLLRFGANFFVASLDGWQAHTVKRPRGFMEELFSTVPIVDDRTIGVFVPGSPDAERYAEHRDLLFELEYGTVFHLGLLFDRLRDEYDVSPDDVLTALCFLPSAKNEDFVFLREAVSSYLAGNWLACLHILVPRLEQVIRRLLRGLGADTTASKGKGLVERPLGELLRAASGVSGLKKELILFLQAVLSEEWGLNLRNRVAHGLLTVKECNRAVADRLLHVGLVLSRLGLELRQSRSSGLDQDEDSEPAPSSEEVEIVDMEREGEQPSDSSG